jgi:hypothetical protein
VIIRIIRAKKSDPELLLVLWEKLRVAALDEPASIAADWRVEIADLELSNIEPASLPK